MTARVEAKLAQLSAAAADAIGRSDWPKAEAVLRRVVKLSGAAPEAHYNLALVLMRVGKLDQVGYWLRRSIALRPDYANAWFELGRWLIDRGDLAEACDAFTDATRLAPRCRRVAQPGDGCTSHRSV